jgi:K+:H+ antiporter
MTTGRHYVAYPLLVGLPLAGLVAVLAYGSHLTAPVAAVTESTVLGSIPVNTSLRIPVFLAQIIAILAVSRTLGKALRAFGQPQVVGEMIAGLLLGPSVLGFFWPDAYGLLFPAGTVQFLTALSQIGLLLFMFLVGLELHPSELRGSGRDAVLTSHVSIVTPLFLGAVLSLLLYPRLSSAEVPFIAFALFVGTALSVTAFPVLALLLAEHRLDATPLGRLAIACAVIDDVSAWCLLAAIAPLAHSGSSAASLLMTLGGLVIFTIVMFTVVRAALRWLIDRARADGEIGQDALAVIFGVALGAAWVTDHLGIHALFGAFVTGLVMPKGDDVIRSIRERSEDLLVVLLLPLFFVATGLRTDVGLIAGAVPLLLLTVVVAVAGKVGGSAVAARATGLSWREGFALGSLLNSRGLIGLVVINVGLEAGVVSPVVYTILVVTAIVTTFMASPMFSAVYRRGSGT